MRKRRLNLPPKNLLAIIQRLPVKLITVIIITSFGILFIVGNANRFLRTSDYFKIEDIVLKDNAAIDLSYLKGQNIFTLDLRKEAQYLARLYPVYYKIRLVRVLPNRIFVDFIKRKPLCIVKLYRDFFVDEEGVLFDAPEQLQDQELPVILGLETKIFGPKSGTIYNVKELLLALNIIRELKSNRVLKDCSIKKINVVSLSNISFFIAAKEFQDLEIKLGADNIRDKISILGGLINQSRNDYPNIKYLDLRFKEPVIKLKDVK